MDDQVRQRAGEMWGDLNAWGSWVACYMILLRSRGAQFENPFAAVGSVLDAHQVGDYTRAAWLAVHRTEGPR